MNTYIITTYIGLKGVPHQFTVQAPSIGYAKIYARMKYPMLLHKDILSVKFTDSTY